MLVNGEPHRTIWREDDRVMVIDQRTLPFDFRTMEIPDLDTMIDAIANMTVRGAGLIGAAAGYGMFLAAMQVGSSEPDIRVRHLREAGERLGASRPTAVNLGWAVDRMLGAIDPTAPAEAFLETARRSADTIADEDVEQCARIGANGLALLVALSEGIDRPLNLLTHCNAGWLAFVDHGTATAPIYAAHDHGIPLHVWVDETRPRNQGSRLTAWELREHGVDHTVIVDNAGGHLMQHGMVDAVIVGSDRTTAAGDVANKIGTYLKALAAHDNDVPFYVALPSSTIDWSTFDGVTDIPIEQRASREVTHVSGRQDDADTETEVLIAASGSKAANYGFDVTPSRFVTALITERGVCDASPSGLSTLFPERSGANP